MVIGVFPLAKLGTLLLGQISKPLANSVKKRAKDNHFFRNYICMPPAQCYNWCEVKASRLGSGIGANVKIPKLNDEKAIELGANLLGEVIVFAIAAAVLLREYGRQVGKEEAKEEDRFNKVASIQSTLQELNIQAERKDAQLRELMRKIAALQGHVVTVPWKRHSPDSPKDIPPDHPTPPPHTSTSSSLPAGASLHTDETPHVPLPSHHLPPSSHPPPPLPSSSSETSPITSQSGSLPPSKDVGTVLKEIGKPEPLIPLTDTTSHTDETSHVPLLSDILPPSSHPPSQSASSSPPEASPITPALASLPPSKDMGSGVKEIDTPEPLIPLTDTTSHTDATSHVPLLSDILPPSSHPPLQSASSSPTEASPITPDLGSLPPSKDMASGVKEIDTPDSLIPLNGTTSPTDEVPHDFTSFDHLPPSEDVGSVLAGNEAREPVAPPVDSTTRTSKTPHGCPPSKSVPPKKDIGSEV